jgi:hypothetical protein
MICRRVVACCILASYSRVYSALGLDGCYFAVQISNNRT